MSTVAFLRYNTTDGGTYPVAVGMLLYAAVVSPGDLAQRGEWPMVGMFAVVLLLALVSLVLVL